jgi:hypothetical protein
MKRTVLLFALVLTMSILWTGCGGNASPGPTTTTATPAPTTPTPTTPTPPSTTPTPPSTTPTPPPTTPTPPPTPTTGGGSSTSGTVQWLSSLNVTGPGAASHGQVTVDTAGNVNVQLTSGGTPNVQYAVSFTNYGDSTSIPVGTFSTDASGNANATMKFPLSGNFAGAFMITHVSGDSFTTVGTAWAQTSAPLLGISTVTTVCSVPGTTCSPATQDPGTGTVTTASGLQHVVLNGAVANATYEVIECVFGGSSCFLQGNLNTDASGNGTFDKTVETSPGQVWRLQRVSGTPATSQGTGFVTAFRVP